ncbi:hypothetical protein UA08_04931B, partial [Talaromyces atroroseus]
MYPSAKVIGNDLSPIQPEYVAPNAEFVIEDFEDEWVYQNDYFDFIHGRTLSGHLNPGGWLEVHEASSKDGRSLNVCEQLKPWMVQAGFEDVQVVVHKIPWGPWAKDPHLKEIGRYQIVNAIESVDSYGLALMTRYVGYTEGHAKIFLAVVKEQIRSKSLHAYNLT